MARHPIETLWREAGLPEYFLGNDGSNVHLYALYDAIVSNSHAELVKPLEKILQLSKPGQTVSLTQAIDILTDIWNESGAALAKATPSRNPQKVVT